MNKVLILNQLNAIVPKAGCSLLGSRNRAEELKSKYAFLQEKLSSEFSEFSKEGYSLGESKILPHVLYVNNGIEDCGSFGVYRFQESPYKFNYKVSFGPYVIINLEKPKVGCSFGCKKKKDEPQEVVVVEEQQDSVGCIETLKKIPYDLGCNREKGDDCQYINFYNDELNDDSVKGINRALGLRKEYSKGDDDFLFMEISSRKQVIEDFSEDRKIFDSKIIEGCKEWLKSMKDAGYGFHSLIDLPSKEYITTSAIVMDNSSSAADLNLIDLSQIDGENIYLSKFDLYSYRTVSVFQKIINKFRSKKNVDVSISAKNINRIQEVFASDFESQRAIEEEQKRKVANTFYTKIPVNLAIEEKCGLLKKLIFGHQYRFTTVYVNAKYNR